MKDTPQVTSLIGRLSATFVKNISSKLFTARTRFRFESAKGAPLPWLNRLGFCPTSPAWPILTWWEQVAILQTVNACQVLLHKLDSSQALWAVCGSWWAVPSFAASSRGFPLGGSVTGARPWMGSRFGVVGLGEMIWKDLEVGITPNTASSNLRVSDMIHNSAVLGFLTVVEPTNSWGLPHLTSGLAVPSLGLPPFAPGLPFASADPRDRRASGKCGAEDGLDEGGRRRAARAAGAGRLVGWGPDVLFRWHRRVGKNEQFGSRTFLAVSILVKFRIFGWTFIVQTPVAACIPFPQECRHRIHYGNLR